MAVSKMCIINFSESSHEMIQQVPQSVVSIANMASTTAGANLFAAAKLFSEEDAKSYDYFPEAYPDVVTPSALAATFINDEFTLYPSPFTSQVSSATFIKTLRLRAVDKLPFWLIEPLKLTAHIFNSIEFFQQLPANLASSSRTTIPNPPTSRPELVTLSSSDDIVSLMNSPPARGQTSSSDYFDVRVYEKLMYKCLIV